MTDVLDTPAALLAELTALGIELQAHGERLRFRPQSAMTPELVARVKVHKPGLLALLANTKTPAGDSAKGGFGSGVSGGAPAALPSAGSEPTDQVAALARVPPGWTPAGWRDRLLYLADRCQRIVPGRAAELRAAAAVGSVRSNGGTLTHQEAWHG